MLKSWIVLRSQARKVKQHLLLIDWLAKYQQIKLITRGWAVLVFEMLNLQNFPKFKHSTEPVVNKVSGQSIQPKQTSSTQS